jgi:hypothetical protein
MAKELYRWEFTEDLKGGHRGFNNPELERFKNGRYRSLTREVIQNSLDAVKDRKKPVYVEFRSIKKPVSDIPDVAGLLNKMTACIPMAKRDKNRAEAAPWFENACNILSGSTIDVLSMSDFNTKGMRGPCEYGTPFYAYMKAMGTSEKDDPNAAGSHGIGKRAPLLSSKLRTLVAVTQYIDPKSKKKEFLAQGFSLLMTHEEKKGAKTIRIDAEGFWGKPDGCLPSNRPDSLPKWMRRDEIGTDIYLLGFDRGPKWQEKMIALTITNFFAAFSRGTLEVKIQDVEISTKTLPALLQNADTYKNSLDDKLDISQFEYAPYFLEAISKNNPEVLVEQSEIIHLGLVEMRIIVREGLPQEYAIIRANMLIITELPELKRFPNYKDFIAVVECKTPEGEKLLRSIEPSRHDSFEIDQLESEDLKKKARVAIGKLVDFIRRSLRKHAREPLQQAGSIDFLGQFLPDETEPGKDASDAEVDPDGKIILTPRPVRPKAFLPSASGGDGGGAATGENEGDNGGDASGGKGEGDDDGGSGGAKGGQLKNNARSPRVIEVSGGKHSLAFTASNTGKFRVHVNAVGLDFEESLKIISTDIGAIENGAVVVSAKANDRIRLGVTLNRASLGTYRLICEEI